MWTLKKRARKSFFFFCTRIYCSHNPSQGVCGPKSQDVFTLRTDTATYKYNYEQKTIIQKDQSKKTEWNYKVCYMLCFFHIVAVQRKTGISEMATLQERLKTSWNLNGIQWNQTSFQAVLAHFCWSILHGISTQCKQQLMWSNEA